MDLSTRKFMTMHKVLHPSDYRDKLYVSWKEGGRGLISVDDCIGAKIEELVEYTKKTKERLITAAKNSNDIIKTNRKTRKTGKKKWKEKQLPVDCIRLCD